MCIYVTTCTVHGSIWIKWCQVQKRVSREDKERKVEARHTTAPLGKKWMWNRWKLICINSHAYKHWAGATLRGEDGTDAGIGQTRQGGAGEAGSLCSRSVGHCFPQGRRVNRQVGTATAGAYRALRTLINSYISGENDEKGRKIDEGELEQAHRSIIFWASRRKYVK